MNVPRRPVSSVSATTSGTPLIYSGGHDRQVCAIDANTGVTRSKFEAAKVAITAGALSPEGSRLLVGTSAVALYDVNSHQRLRKFTGHPVS